MRVFDRAVLGSLVFAIAMLAGCGGGGGGSSTAGPGGSTTPPSIDQITGSLAYIDVTPSFPASLAKGLSQKFTATAYYLNGTTQNVTSSATWNSVSPTVATVDASGLVKGAGVGSTNITASIGNVSSTIVTVTVTPAELTAITVTPGNATIPAGLSKQFAATGTYTDGSTQDITSTVTWGGPWGTANQSGPGLFKGITEGVATITASKQGAQWANISGSATLTISNYIVSGTLSLLPAGGSVVLQNNGADNLTLTANGPFTFNTALASAAAYSTSVLVQSQAPAHICHVLEGYGTITTSYITSVQIVCGMAVDTFAGSASGLVGATNATGRAASFNNPSAVAVDTSGNIYVADTYNNLIRKISPSGVVTTLAGSGAAGAVNGTGTAASFNWPTGVAVDASGNVYVADYNNNMIRKITAAGGVSTLAGAGWGFANGAGNVATFNGPTSVAVDTAGNVYVADKVNSLIRKITAAGVVSTLAGTATFTGTTNGTGAAARFNFPEGVAVDAAGNVYVADTSNQLIRKITPAGVVTTLAGSAGVSGQVDGNGTAATFFNPVGIAVDAAGTVYVAEIYNHVIRAITAAGAVSTLAGTLTTGQSINGPASSANFKHPSGVALDAAGNWYVADSWNNMIRKIMP